MKIIDKYILRTLSTALLYILLAFVVLYLIMDLFSNMSTFVDQSTPFPKVLKYYLVLIPSSFIYIMPITILLAVLYSLYSLTHSNEFTAMRASGIGLYRLIAPILFVGLILSIFVLMINETLGPKSRYFAETFLSEQKGRRLKSSSHIVHQLAYRNGTARRIWNIDEFNLATQKLKGIKLKQEKIDRKYDFKIWAREGSWLDETWWFFDVQIRRFNKQGYPIITAYERLHGKLEIKKRVEMAELDETPMDFVNATKDPIYLNNWELKEYLDKNADLSDKKRARFNTRFHFFLAMPWACLIVTFMGVPFGHNTARKGALMGVIFCLMLCFSYYAVCELLLALGERQIIPGWLAGWSPNFFYLLIGIILVLRMR